MADAFARYAFRIVNVFTAGGALSGNPLCVFEDARGLDDAALQGLARQFNLSETTFVRSPAIPRSAPLSS
jgi:trans-2,3-dihydro-3-hydroxyanthranilate isomerase